MKSSRFLKGRQPLASLVEGVDYYLENGLLVFTATWHLKRGYCCKSGCRHCPYKKEVTDSTQQEE